MCSPWGRVHRQDTASDGAIRLPHKKYSCTTALFPSFGVLPFGDEYKGRFSDFPPAYLEPLSPTFFLITWRFWFFRSALLLVNIHKNSPALLLVLFPYHGKISNRQNVSNPPNMQSSTLANDEEPDPLEQSQPPPHRLFLPGPAFIRCLHVFLFPPYGPLIPPQSPDFFPVCPR